MCLPQTGQRRCAESGTGETGFERCIFECWRGLTVGVFGISLFVEDAVELLVHYTAEDVGEAWHWSRDTRAKDIGEGGVAQDSS